MRRSTCGRRREEGASHSRIKQRPGREGRNGARRLALKIGEGNGETENRGIGETERRGNGESENRGDGEGKGEAETCNPKRATRNAQPVTLNAQPATPSVVEEGPDVGGIEETRRSGRSTAHTPARCEGCNAAVGSWCGRGRGDAANRTKGEAGGKRESFIRSGMDRYIKVRGTTSSETYP